MPEQPTAAPPLPRARDASPLRRWQLPVPNSSASGCRGGGGGCQRRCAFSQLWYTARLVRGGGCHSSDDGAGLCATTSIVFAPALIHTVLSKVSKVSAVFNNARARIQPRPLRPLRGHEYTRGKRAYPLAAEVNQKVECNGFRHSFHNL